MSGTPPTPMLNKMSAVRDESQGIGEFLDWLGQQGWQIARYGTTTSHERCTGETLLGPECQDGILRPGTHAERPCNHCAGTGYYNRPVDGWSTRPGTIEDLLAEYFEIDLTVADREKQALLNHIRENGA